MDDYEQRMEEKFRNFPNDCLAWSKIALVAAALSYIAAIVLMIVVSNGWAIAAIVAGVYFCICSLFSQLLARFFGRLEKVKQDSLFDQEGQASTTSE